MPKVKISEYSATANSNTDVASINIDEGCAPSGINNAIRAVMGHLKDFQQGTNGDPFNGPHNGTVGATTASTANVTTLTTSSTVTHNGGTANGVAYLNGSKVLTTGSALVFDGTNLGVGVTPSAWSGYKSLDLQGGSFASGSGTSVEMWCNSFYNGTNSVYRNTGFATLYNQGTGAHRWYNAPSGTAGNAITFTQAMTLDASGNQLLGVTSNTNANNRLYVVGPLASYTSSATTLATSATSASVRLSFAQDSSQSIFMGMATDGTNYPSYIQAANGGGTTASNLTLQPFGGNLLVGTTSTVAGAAFVVSKSVNDYLARFINSNATAYGVVVNYSGASPNSTGQEFFRCVDSTADRMLVRSNGGIANYSANNVNLSDRREKTNFAPAKSYLDVICSIPVQTYNYIDQNMEEDGGLTLGVVAQDVQVVAPELVTVSDWSAEKDGSKMRLSIYQTDLQYALMKCIQEQQALITQLTARITALEGA